VLSTLATLAFGFFAAGLGQTSLGYLGIPLAASLTLILFMNITLYVLNKKVKALDIEGILSTFTKCLFATLLMGIFLWAGARFLPTGEGMMRNMWAFIRLSVLGLTGAWIYYGTTRLLNIEESRVFDRVFQRLNRLVKSPSPKQIEVSSPHSITLKEEVRN
jgi:peptidoglycan biosynthesis protein MviN/MurJ (putative lipid II flippase)